MLRGEAHRSGPGRALTATSQSARPGSRSALQGVLKVAEPVASTLDVQDVGVVAQPVEEGRGQNLVSGGGAVAGSAIRNRFAGHPSRSAKTRHAPRP